MALRAIISRDQPDPAGEWQDLWCGPASEDEEGAGITTAAILSFFPEASPGKWYRLEEFDALVEQVDWNMESESWTSLKLQEQDVDDSTPFVADIHLGEAVKSYCYNAVEVLKSLEKKHVWIRFE